MIAVDTSALMAILLNESQSEACVTALERNEALMISAATVAEALIVAAQRNVDKEMARLIGELGFEIVPVNGDAAARVAQAYARWGKGRHPAGLNFGDCFAYDLARHLRCPLLFVGDDFSRTDIDRVL